MSCSILYVYDKNSDGETVLLGAEIHGLDGKPFKMKGVYVGIPFVLEDLVNEINRKTLGIKNMKLFEERYKAVDAKGIVFFPQTNRYAFLEEGESVVLWNGDDRIEEYLDNALKEFKNEKISDTNEANFDTMRERIASLDDDDPFIELCDGNSRRRVSNR